MSLLVRSRYHYHEGCVSKLDPTDIETLLISHTIHAANERIWIDICSCFLNVKHTLTRYMYVRTVAIQESSALGGCFRPFFSIGDIPKDECIPIGDAAICCIL